MKQLNEIDDLGDIYYVCFLTEGECNKCHDRVRVATKSFLAPELYICSLFKILPVKHIRHFTQLFPHRIFVVEDKCTNAEYTRIRSTKY